MNNIKSITLVFLCSLLFTSAFQCKKDNNGINARLIKDCTGTYIQINGKDYQVCNTEKTDALNADLNVKVEYTKITECTGSAASAIVCMMYHPNEGWIEIKNIDPI